MKSLLTRRLQASLLVLCLLVTTSLSAAKLDLATATIADLQAAMKSGALTSEHLTELYLARIAAYDKQGPRINAVITLNAKALETARALDAERKAGKVRGPLHGIPIVLKDLFDTADMPTTAGFLPMATSQPSRDAFFVKKLRDAGAIILAKVNLSDWFGVPPLGDQSTLLGRTSNPYNLELTPGGSSGGTGASVASWFATAGVGSETGVSIRNPLSNNNLVGIAATQGLISRTGQIMTSYTQERPGPFARNVYDMAVMLSVMRCFDVEDLTTAESQGNVPTKPYTEFLAPSDGLKGARIGVLRDLFRSGPKHSEGLALIEKALIDMKAKGAVIVDGLSTGLNLFDVLSTARTNNDEARFSYELYLSRLPKAAPIRSFAELLEKGGAILKPSIRESALVPAIETYDIHTSRLKTRESLRALAIDLMNRYQLDAIVYPFKTEPPLPHKEKAEESDNPFSSVTGLPGLIMPAGFAKGNAPIAIEFLGRPWSEPTLIRLASAFETATHHRTPPPTVPALPGETIEY